jgi:magnesium transporter
MKFLTAITVVLSVPTMISSFYGMNVPLPFQENTFGFIYMIIISVVLTVVTVVYLLKKGMF